MVTNLHFAIRRRITTLFRRARAKRSPIVHELSALPETVGGLDRLADGVSEGLLNLPAKAMKPRRRGAGQSDRTASQCLAQESLGRAPGRGS